MNSEDKGKERESEREGGVGGGGNKECQRLEIFE